MLIMGHYFGDKQARTWIKFRKKPIRTITYNNYTAHTEPLLKELNLLKVKDMFDPKILKFLFKLYHNELPPYFNIYRQARVQELVRGGGQNLKVFFFFFLLFNFSGGGGPAQKRDEKMIF